MESAPKGTRLIRASGVKTEYGIPEQTLANWRSLGRGPEYLKLSSRQVLYDRATLENWLAAHKVTPRVGP